MGFIGKSKNPRASYDLSNALLVKTEIRGEHATGFWACERGEGSIFFDKEAVKSTIYSGRDIWSKDFAESNCDILLGHCRFSTLSAGMGHERYNKNNHPHVSGDKRVALVHNGKIPEYGPLKSRYELRSDCDSEILLSMFESGEEHKAKEDYLRKEFPNLTPDVAYRMMGLREIFSRVNYGAMAVAIGERGEHNPRSRFLWLFRDEERPLWVVDMRKSLGQIFFCSTAEIWKSAIEMTPSVKPYIDDDMRVIEFPPYQVWMLATQPTDDPEVDAWRIKKFRITKTKFYDMATEDEYKKTYRPKVTKPVAPLISRLAADEEVKKDTKTPVATKVSESSATSAKKKVTVTRYEDQEGDVTDGICGAGTDEDYQARHAAKSSDSAVENLTIVDPELPEIDMEAFDNMVKELRNILNDIETSVKNHNQDQSLSTKDFGVVMDSLRDTQAELKGSLLFLKN